jgi:hypothetical protein
VGDPPDATPSAPQASATVVGDRARIAPAAPASDHRPSLTVPVRKGDVVIDGRLDEPAWSRAGRTGAFVNVGSGKPDPRQPVQGDAALLWDESHLYVAFVVADRDLRGGFASDAIDPQLWTRDTVEIMIDPEGDNRDYYEIQISPQNLVFDSRFDDYNLPRGGPAGPFGHQAWSAKIESAVVLDGTIDDDVPDRGYTVEARVPWASFDKLRRPRLGERWRMNFYAMQNNGGAAWSPILGEGNFHKASRFGEVTFGP